MNKQNVIRLHHNKSLTEAQRGNRFEEKHDPWHKTNHDWPSMGVQLLKCSSMQSLERSSHFDKLQPRIDNDQLRFGTRHTVTTPHLTITYI